MQVRLEIKMSSLTPFKFDKTSLFTLTIDGKVLTRAKKVVQCALQYPKKTASVIRAHCSPENYAHKYKVLHELVEMALRLAKKTRPLHQ